jgi:DNA-binding transcriptional regulator YdaS (Cro superfamily)
MQTVEDVYRLWPSAAALARDIGVPGVTVRQWRNRGYRIPPRYWPSIQLAARAKSAEIPLHVFLPE